MNEEGLQKTIGELLAANRKTQQNLDEIRNQFPIQPENLSDETPNWSELEEGGLEPPGEGGDIADQLAFPTGIGLVEHGSEGATARPTQYGHYIWVGSVEPANAESKDFWVEALESDIETLKEEILALETDDTLRSEAGTTETLEGREGWEKPEWADNIGEMHNKAGDRGWFSTTDKKVAAAVWNKEEPSVEGNTIIVETSFTSSGENISPVKNTERAIWLLSDVDGQSGYRFVEKFLTGVNSYDFRFRLERWEGGNATILAESKTYNAGEGAGFRLQEGQFVLAVDGQGVAVYRGNLNELGSFELVLSAADTTYSSGKGGIESELADFGAIAGANGEGFRVGTVNASATSLVTLYFRLLESWFEL